MKKAVLLSFAMLILFAGLLSVVTSAKATDSAKLNAIVRLHNKDGKFFCSGSVVSDALVVTAAHCLSWIPDGEEIEIRGANAQPLGIRTKVWKFNERQDLGIVMADVKQFDKMAIEVRPEAIVSSFDRSQDLMLCGYPNGGQLYCTKFVHTQNLLTQKSGKSNAWPGMSGGPLIDMERGVIIATLYGYNADKLNEIVVNPTVELWVLMYR